MPTMNLSTFDDNPEKWLEFRNGFHGFVDANRDLTNSAHVLSQIIAKGQKISIKFK